MTADDSIASPTPDDGVLWDVLDEHFDELESAVTRLGRAHAHPLTTLSELSRGAEARLRAHLDGLVIAMPAVAPELARRLTEKVEPEKPAGMSALALAFTSGGLFEVVEPLFSHDDKRLRLAAVRGCVLASSDRLDRAVRLRRTRSPGELAAWLEYAGLRSLAPPESSALAGILHSEERVVVEAALRCLREPIPSLAQTMERLAEHPEPLVRERALRVALAWQTPRSFLICEEQSLDASILSPTAMTAYAILGGPKEHARLARSADSKERRPHVLRALGFSGSAGAVPELLERLTARSPIDAKVAAQAIAAIAGLDLRRAEFALSEPSPPTPDEVGEESSAEDPPAPEDLLEPPNAITIREWWKSAASSMTPNPSQRLIFGTPRTPQSVLHALEHGPLGLRGGWALAAHLWSRGRFWLDVEALSETQRKELATARDAAGQWANNRLANE